MTLLTVQLQIFGIYDRGVPNSERIVLYANGPINLSLYGLILGVKTPAGDSIFPIPDQFLWLGNTQLQTPGWVFVFTGPGAQGMSQETITKQPIHVLYWGKTGTVLNDPTVLPALVRFDNIEIGNQPNKDVAQLLTPKDKPTQDDFYAELLSHFAQPKDSS